MTIYKLKVTNKLAAQKSYLADLMVEPGDSITRKIYDLSREYARDLKTDPKNIQIKYLKTQRIGKRFAY